MNDDCLYRLKAVVSDDVYNKLEAATKMSDPNKGHFEWDKTIQEAHADMRWLKRQAIMDASVMSENLTYIQKRADDFIASKGVTRDTPKGKKAWGEEAARALSDMISGAGMNQRAGMVSLERYIEGITRSNMQKIAQLLHKTRPSKMGLSRHGGDEVSSKIARSIFGSKVDAMTPDMVAIKNAWEEVTNGLMERFNRAGGNIAGMKDFGIPTNHDIAKIGQTPMPKWVADAKGFFKVRRPPHATGDWDETKVLESIYLNLTTGKGEDLGTALPKKGELSVGNSHQMWRYLQPIDGTAWMEYNKKYGTHANPVDAMIDYITNMSTTIGIMERLGSNARKNLTEVAKHVQDVSGNKSAGTEAAMSFDQIAPEFKDAATIPMQILRGFRHFQTITKLGMAPISAVSDVAYGSIAAVHNGMNPFTVFGSHMKSLVSSSDRKLAGEMGLTLEYALSRSAALNRYADSVGYGLFQRTADFSTRLSGLNAWTHAGKVAFVMEMSRNLGKAATTGRLTKGMAKTLERNGITEADWNVLKTTVRDGYLDPSRLGPEHQQLQSRFTGMMAEETSFAIPEPNARVRGWTQLGTSRNTLANEFIKTATQFKSFGVSVLLSQIGRIVSDTSGIPTRVGYGAGLLVGTSAAGYLALNLKDFARGRTPRELSPGLVWDSMLQGGSFAIAADIFFKDPNVFGGTLAYLAGPTASDFVNLQKYLIGGYNKAESDGIAAALYENIVPGAVNQIHKANFIGNLWYMKTMWERAVVVKSNEFSDPNSRKKEANTRKWLREEHGQRSYFD